MKLADFLILFLVIVAANVVGNLIVAKVVADQAQAHAGNTPLGKLLGAL